MPNIGKMYTKWQHKSQGWINAHWQVQDLTKTKNLQICGRSIKKNEKETAVKRMKIGKTAGLNNFPIELIEAFGDWGTTKVIKILNEIYESGVLPNELSKSIFMMLLKKPGVNWCGLHRTISLMSHNTMQLLLILLQRMKCKFRPEICCS